MQTTTTRISTAPAVATLACADLGAEVRYYRDTLGFDVDEMNGTAIVHCGKNSDISIYERPTPPQCDTTAVTFVVDDLEAVMADLRGRGVRFQDYDLPYLHTVNGMATYSDGTKGAWTVDPAGNTLALIQM